MLGFKTLRGLGLCLLLAVFCAAPRAAAPKKAARPARVPIILDTDIGDDIDDTWALAALLGSPRVDLKLIVTETDDTQAKTRLVAKMLQQMGRTDIPIATGIKTKDKILNQAKWLGDYALDQYPGKVLPDGVTALIEAVKAAPGPITICAIGPVTNLAAALKRDPSIAQKARLVAMAGSVEIGYKGKPGRSAEYNVVRDVPAWQAVMAASWPITIAPLDSCGVLRLSGERFARVAASKAPRARTVIENYDLWANRAHHPKDASSILFDTVAAYLCLGEKYCEMKTVKLRVDDKGFTVPDEAKGRPVACAMAFKNRPALEEWLVRSLAGKKK